jgi:hypothetical protein
MSIVFDPQKFHFKNQPKIKLIHLLLDPGIKGDIPDSMWSRRMEIQGDSISAWSQIAKRMFRHSPRYSEINRTLLPIENCADTSILNPTKDLNVSGNLSYGHYGAYLAHRNAILEEFDDDLDAILIVESDVQFIPDAQTMYEEIVNAYHFASDNNGAMVTFGAVRFGQNHSTPENELTVDFGDYNKIAHFLCAHCYMILSSEKDRIKDKILNSKWHAWDIWLYWNYDTDKSVNIFSTKTPLAFEPEGISMIDYHDKPNNLKA